MDSDATEIYDPPELLDETKQEQVKPLRGKLKITKLTLTKSTFTCTKRWTIDVTLVAKASPSAAS